MEIINKYHLFLFYCIGCAMAAGYGSDRKLCPAMKNVAQPADRIDTSQRLASLRQEMLKMTSVRGPPLDAFIVTSYDQHMSEFVADRDRRLRWISGFSGDHGLAIITMSKAILWTAPLDRLQADIELSCEWLLLSSSDMPPGAWLKKELSPGSRVGLDYTLISHRQWDLLSKALQNSSIYMTNVPTNLIDIIWTHQRQHYSKHEAHVWPMEYAGKTWQTKLQSVRDRMKEESCDALIVTALDEVAWLLNIRGRDIPHLPVLTAYVLVTKEQLHLYTNLNKLGVAVRTHLHTAACFSPYCARIHEYRQVFDDLQTFSQIWKKVWVPDESPYSPGASKAISSAIPSDKRFLQRSPIVSLKAEKNAKEREGMRKAHIRDSAALCDLMAYLEQKLSTGEYVNELSLALLLDQFRREQQLSQGVIPTIVGFGPHGALPHFQPTNATALKIDNTSLLVIDSGGFYLDGTTDVSRTFHFGIPTREQRTAYTRVLMGLISFSRLIFPEGLPTSKMDVLARAPLWDVLTDYPHGTGHGIGAYLSVHEGPIAVSWDAKEDELLKEGHFFSIEPGYYVEDKFGVRLENIVEVVDRNNKTEVNVKYLGFNPVTLVPFEPKLMDINMLSPQQIRWLNEYNSLVRNEIGSELKRQMKMVGFHWMLKRVDLISERSSATSLPSLSQLSTSVLAFILVFYFQTILL